MRGAEAADIGARLDEHDSSIPDVDAATWRATGVRSFAAELSQYFDLYVGVPDSELQFLIDDLLYTYRDDHCYCVPREDVAIGCAVGHLLAGGRPLVFAGMQGLATCIDALTSLCVAAEIPVVILSAWTATADAGVAHKRAIGARLPDLLAAAQIAVVVVNDRTEIVSALASASQDMLETTRPKVVLLRSSSAGDHDGT